MGTSNLPESVSESGTTKLIALLWLSLKSHYISITISVFVVRLLLRKYLSPLRDLPGPLVASCTRAWKVWSTASGHTERDHIRLHQQYGPMVRIAPNEVSFDSPQIAREVLSAGKGFHKTDFYRVFPPPENPDIFTETREAVHAQKKRVANVPYAMSTMQTMAPLIEETEQLLFERLSDFRDQPGKICDLGDWLHFFAFDVLGEVAFSTKFGFLEAGYDVGKAIKTIDDSQWYNGIVGQIPFMDIFLRRNPIWKILSYFTTSVTPLITRMALEQMAIRKQQQQAGVERKQRDLLDHLFKGARERADKFTEGDVFAIAHGAIFAGSDSTASTMQSFFWYLLRHPNAYHRVLAEVDEARNAGRLSDMVTYSEALNLPFFQSCLRESMRLRPAVGVNITRLVPPGGVELGGRRFKAGTRLAVNGWVLHRDRQIFGSDADVYRPERWLEDEEKARFMDRHMFQFGGGAHLCIGRNLALLEMNKLLPQLLRDYHFELVRPEAELKSHSTFFVVQHGLEVYVTSRKRWSDDLM